MKYGILKSASNTGADSDLAAIFVAPIAITSFSPSLNSDTLSLKIIRSRNPSQRWEISAAIHPGMLAVDYFLKTIVAGESDTVFVRMPPVLGSVPIPAATVFTVSSAAAAGANTLQVSSSGVNLSSALFITFPGDPKVYTVVSHISTTLTIYPKLRKSVASGAVLTHSDAVVMSAILSGDTLKGISFSDGILSSPGTVKLAEDI